MFKTFTFVAFEHFLVLVLAICTNAFWGYIKNMEEIALKDIEYTRKLIFKIMRDRGETQKEFSEAIGISRSMISKWETGVNSSFVNKNNIVKISKHFGVSVDYLLGTKDDIDLELSEYLTELKNRPEMRTLFKVSKGTTKEDVEKAIKIIEALKK